MQQENRVISKKNTTQSVVSLVLFLRHNLFSQDPELTDHTFVNSYLCNLRKK